MDRLAQLTAPAGRIYLTLRLGPGDPNRSMWPVSADELEALAQARNLELIDLGRQPDLLGRDEIAWETLLLTRR